MIVKYNRKLPYYICSFSANACDIEIYKNAELKSSVKSARVATRFILSLRQQVYWQKLTNVIT